MKRLLNLLICLSVCFTTFGQTHRDQFNQAQELYNVGRIDEAQKLLEKNWSSYVNSEVYNSACRLMTLCLLEQDKRQQAEQYASELLSSNPYYSPDIDDPQRYIDLIASIRSGQVSITSASQLAETLEEAPVPVVLITEDMIRQSGARNLQDLLVLYVPGITRVEGMNTNVAVNGTYSQMQEKILVMLDGQRLNSQTTNSMSLDERTSLEKVKQIEVLRGPASSLYGNVALTAVVNIITKSGDEIDGVKISGGAGLYDTYRADLLMGKRYMDLDVTAWASFFSSQGERRYCRIGDRDFFTSTNIQSASYRLNSMEGTPAFDVGAKLKFHDWSFLFTMQQGKKTDVYSPLVTYGLYDYSRYPTVDGNTPGFTSRNILARLNYNHTWGRFTLNGTAFAQWEQGNIYYVAGDSIPEGDHEFCDIVMDWPLILPDHSNLTYNYNYESQSWRDFTVGALATGTYSYDLRGYRGTLLGGAQFERFSMLDSWMIRGDGGGKISIYMPEGLRSLKLGSELNFSSFVQWKQALPAHLIFNTGLRFDHKRRLDNRRLNAFSPRVALIYNGLKNTNIKLTYAHSFVDASYLYRANTTLAYAGGAYLEPEELDAVQLNALYNFGNSGFSLEANLFYKFYSNLVVLTPSTGLLANLGKRKQLGIEGTASYHKGRHNAFVSLAWHQLINDDYLSITKSREIYGVPQFHSTMGYDVLAMDHKRAGRLYLNANLEILGSRKESVATIPTYSGYDINFDDFLENYNIQQSATALVNVGANYQKGRLGISVNVYNLLGNDYFTGGSVPYPVYQQRRTFMGKISIDL